MERIAFRMRLKPGCSADYRDHHAAIWPELAALLKQAGIADYTIHHDPETDALYATLLRPADHGMDTLPAEAVMRRWWTYMAPLMDTEADGSPVVVPLVPMFHLP